MKKRSPFVAGSFPRFVALSLVVAGCGTDGIAGGGTDAGPEASRRDDCLRFLAAECDYVDDCYNFDEFDKDDCIDEAASKCDDVVDTSSEDVDRCVSALAEIECDASIPRACNGAVTFPDEDEDDGTGGTGGGTVGDGDGDGGGDGGGDGDGDGGAPASYACCINGYNYVCPDEATLDACFASGETFGCELVEIRDDGSCIHDEESGECREAGEPCADAACCEGATCVGFEGEDAMTCAADCAFDDDCASGCCYIFDGDDEGVCVPGDYCG